MSKSSPADAPTWIRTTTTNQPVRRNNTGKSARAPWSATRRSSRYYYCPAHPNTRGVSGQPIRRATRSPGADNHLPDGPDGPRRHPRLCRDRTPSRHHRPASPYHRDKGDFLSAQCPTTAPGRQRRRPRPTRSCTQTDGAQTIRSHRHEPPNRRDAGLPPRTRHRGPRHHHHAQRTFPSFFACLAFYTCNPLHRMPSMRLEGMGWKR